MRERIGLPSREDGTNRVALTASIAGRTSASDASPGTREISTADSTSPVGATTTCSVTCVSRAGSPTGDGTTMGTAGSACVSCAMAALGTTSTPAIAARASIHAARAPLGRPAVKTRTATTRSHQAPLAVVQGRDVAVGRFVRIEGIDEAVGNGRYEGDGRARAGGERGDRRTLGEARGRGAPGGHGRIRRGHAG